MNELLTATKDEPRVDTRVLAEHLGNQHQSLFELVKEHQPRFEVFGKVRFETGASAGSKTGQKVKFALLNEDQCFLALSFSRNTERVLDLKTRLIQAFREARTAHELTTTEYLPTYHALHDEIHRLAAGSPNERFVHMNVNKAINKAIGIEAGTRGDADLPCKSLLVVTQMAAANAMKGANDHHDGYASAKAAIAKVAAAIAGPAPRTIEHAA